MTRKQRDLNFNTSWYTYNWLSIEHFILPVSSESSCEQKLESLNTSLEEVWKGIFQSGHERYNNLTEEAKNNFLLSGNKPPFSEDDLLWMKENLFPYVSSSTTGYSLSKSNAFPEYFDTDVPNFDEFVTLNDSTNEVFVIIVYND